MDERGWNELAHGKLVGSRIVKAEYMPEDEAEHLGYRCRPLVLTLDNGLVLHPMADDEGNDGGAINCEQMEEGGFPVL